MSRSHQHHREGLLEEQLGYSDSDHDGTEHTQSRRLPHRGHEGWQCPQAWGLWGGTALTITKTQLPSTSNEAWKLD